MRLANWIYTLPLKLRLLFQRRDVDQELDEELHYHIESKTEAYIAKGLSAEEARRAALIDLGGVEQTKEAVRDQRIGNWLHSVFSDCRYGIRQLRKSPAFTAVAILTLALGIGATTAIFSAVNSILFQSLPYPQANRIVSIWEIRNDRSHYAVTFGMYRGLLPQQHSLESIAVVRPWQPTLTGAAQPERLEGQRVSASYLHVLGVSPLLGRSFDASEDQLHGPNVVILSDALWRRRFGADPGIIGRQITLDESESFAESTSYTVIGVMSRNFENVLAPEAELWVPLQYDISQGRAWGHHLQMVGRLQPGVRPADASRELTVLGKIVLDDQHPVSYGKDIRFNVLSLQDDLTSGVRPALLAIVAAVLLLLVIACVNVTNLLLARGVLRQGEFAVRSALGAGSKRLVRQLLTESLLLAALGSLSGLLVANFCVRALVALGPADLPRLHAIGIDPAAFAFGFLATTLIGLAFGLTPALHAARSVPQRGLQISSQRMIGGHRRIRSALVVVEVALALVLLVCSGLLLRSMQTLFAVPPGFNASNILTMQIEEVGHRYDDDAARYRFFSQALDAVRRVNGVTSAALTSQLPLSGDSDIYGVSFERDGSSANGEEAFRYAVTPGYLEILQVPLCSGRFLGDGDRAGWPLVALISESFAKRKLPGVDPRGQRIHIGDPNTWYTIVGVVGDVRQMSLAIRQPDAVYVTNAQWHWVDTVMSLVVRTQGNAQALAPDIRSAIWSVDKDQPIVRIATMERLLAASAAERRFSLILFEVFAIAAVLLAAAGIYGVVSGIVAERTREIGVRSALGATRVNIIALVLRQGLTLAGVGVVIGLVAAVLSSFLIVTMLFGVSHLDPFTYLTVIFLLLAVSTIACSIPAWRAARIDPMIALRYE
jgi:putative ABC transport system permease protein